MAYPTLTTKPGAIEIAGAISIAPGFVVSVG